MPDVTQNLTPARAARRASPLRRLAGSRPLTLLLLIFLLCLYMTLRFPENFPTSYNASALLLNAAQNGILVVGMMLLMISGRFDLSIGSTLAMAGVAAGVLVADYGVSAPLAALGGVALGAAAGAVNGLIVTKLQINALIATLATMTIFRGLTQLVASTGVSPIGDDFKALGQTVFLGIETPFWGMLVIVLIGTWAVSRTRFFRQFYFVGGNERAAKLSGINVTQLVWLGFVLMGALAGLAGVLGSARLNAAVVSAGIGIELNVITAAVLGGASLKGGEGTIIGGVLGVLFIAIVQNALIINGVSVFWQNIIVGLVLLLAVSFERLKTAARA